MSDWDEMSQNPDSVEDSEMMAEHNHEESLERYRKLLGGLDAVFSTSVPQGPSTAIEARKEIVASYGLRPPGADVAFQELAGKELELAKSCTIGRGFGQSKVWTPLNQAIIHGGECDLRHVLLIEMGLVQREVSGNSKVGPPWFRGNWRNMVKVIESVHSMQKGRGGMHTELAGGARLVQVIPVKWKIGGDGHLFSTPSTGEGYEEYLTYIGCRIDDPELSSITGAEGKRAVDYWMPDEIKFLAKTREFFTKAQESAGPADEGWIAIPFGASEIESRITNWDSWANGVPASLWDSMPGPPGAFGSHRGDSK